MHRLQELVRLHRLGRGSHAIARALAMSPNTERRYREVFAEAGILVGDPTILPELDELRALIDAKLAAKAPKQEVSSVAAWRPEIEALHRSGAGARAIYDSLRRETKDCDGSYAAVKRLCRRLSVAAGPKEADVAIPIDAPAGEAQLDFGYLGLFHDPSTGTLRKTWVFVLVLAQSRRMVCRLAFDQSIDTWIRLHVEAFDELGGAPTTLVPDNLKAAVLRAAFGVDERAELSRSYRELARHYGVQIDPTPPASPQMKGRVESAVRYIRRNFLPTLGAGEHTVDELAVALARWVDQTANQRLHGTTGRRPADAFEAERAALAPLPASRYQPTIWKKAQVHRDSHVVFERRLYSVPWRLIGKEVWLRVDPQSVAIFCDDARVAAHARRGPGPRSTHPDHLPRERAALGQRSRAHWEERAAAIGPEALDFIRGVFARDDVLSMLRPVQAIVTHLEGFPRERALAACRRADYYGAHTYGAIKRILKQGLDLQPLPIAVIPEPAAGDEAASSPAPAYRFARRLCELIHQPLENDHERHH